MDKYSGKRGGIGLNRPRKGNNVNDIDHNPQFCNRIGCSGKIKYSQCTKIGRSDKAKCTKTTLYPSNGNETIGSSSRSSSVVTSAKGSFPDSKRKLPSQLEFNSSATEIGSSSVQSKIRPRDKSQHKFDLNNRNAQSTSSVPSVYQPSLNGSNNRGRLGPTNMKCNSISDVVISCSSSGSKAAGKNAMKKKVSEGERKTTLDGPFRPSKSGISISEDPSNAASMRTRKSMNVNSSMMRLRYGQNERNNLSLHEPDSEITISVGGSPHQFSENASSSGSSSYSLSCNNSGNRTINMPFTLSQLGFTRFMNRDGLQRYNMDGITEVLLALERIEQVEQLTHEQVLALETGLLLSSLNLYDQHRDMRLDIDSMSYEELLALEERMGTVSTALSDESLLKCLEICIYKETTSGVRVKGSSGDEEDEIKCSICQEDYIVGDEIGKLVECKHGFHSTCINQWLRVKNWCPICKAAAESSY